MDGIEQRVETMEEKVDSQLTEVNAKLDRLLNKVATCDDLARIDDKIDDFKSTQEIFNSEQTSKTEALARRVRSLEDGGARHSRERELLSSIETSTFKDDYMEARRSLIVSPCSASTEAVREFLSKKMEIDHDILQDVMVQEIKRLHRKGKRRGQNETRAKIIFQTVYDRDLIMSFASNLSLIHI